MSSDSTVTLVSPERKKPKPNIVEDKRLLGFNPFWVTKLDLGGISEGRVDIYLSGCLPEWIQRLANLEILQAPRLGIVVLEPWLVDLKKLTVLDLDQNNVSTWPYFLSQSSSLQTVVLDGNPCLEKAFQKSPTLRSLYFSWNATTASNRSIPDSIRGPEWHVASLARSSSNVNINDLGFFCGGIYSLATPPNLSDDGFLTPLGMCTMIEREIEYKSTGEFKYDEITPQKTPQYQTEGSKQSSMILEIFDDITALLNRKLFEKAEAKQPFVLLAGTPSDYFNKLLKGSLKRLRLEEMNKFCNDLQQEEIRYIKRLKIVESEFYYNSKARNSSISFSLREVFRGFPAMRIIHEKSIAPALANFVRAIGYSMIRKKNPKYIPPFTVGQAVVELCTAFRKLQLSMQKYTENIWLAEHHLDSVNASTKMYQNKEFKNYVEKQIAKLVGMGGHMPFAGSTGIDTKSRLNSNEIMDEVDFSKHTVAEWIYRNPNKYKAMFHHNISDFIYDPLVRLVRYERFFTSLTVTDQLFQPILKVLRKLRNLCAINIQHERKVIRCKILSKKFRTSLTKFSDYQWDAVLTVHSRGYLEKGILSINTNDVIDCNDDVASFVKEVFHDSRLRVLRLVGCGTEVLIWDEVFEHLICKIKKSKVIAIPSKKGIDKEIRIIFVNVRETCLVNVKDFNARYFTPNHPNIELFEALSIKGRKKIL